jgi:hypothetical protein
MGGYFASLQGKSGDKVVHEWAQNTVEVQKNKHVEYKPLAIKYTPKA